MSDGSCLTLMTPRFAMLILVLVAALAGAAETRPNIVLVIGEDMGPDTGAYRLQGRHHPQHGPARPGGRALHPGLHPLRGLRPFPESGWSRASTR